MQRDSIPECPLVTDPGVSGVRTPTTSKKPKPRIVTRARRNPIPNRVYFERRCE
jgi:hypothetical protein